MAASEPSGPPAHPKPSGSRRLQHRKGLNIYSLSAGQEDKREKQQAKPELNWILFFILVCHEVIEPMCL